MAIKNDIKCIKKLVSNIVQDISDIWIYRWKYPEVLEYSEKAKLDHYKWINKEMKELSDIVYNNLLEDDEFITKENFLDYMLYSNIRNILNSWIEWDKNIMKMILDLN